MANIDSAFCGFWIYPIDFCCKSYRNYVRHAPRVLRHTDFGSLLYSMAILTKSIADHVPFGDIVERLD